MNQSTPQLGFYHERTKVNSITPMIDSLEPYWGPAAGVATAMLWTLTIVFFTAAGRRIGPTFVNSFRILLAIGLHAVTYRLLAGRWIPDAEAGQVLYLAVSGVVGLSIGDQALLVAFLDVGPRITALLMATAPLFAVFFGWAVLGETLHGVAWVGILLVLGGVAWVVMERPETASATHWPNRLRGVILGIVGAACQAGGLLLSKQGIGHGWLPVEDHLEPQSATLIRMFFAGLGMLPILLISRYKERRRIAKGLAPSRTGSPLPGMMFAACGAVVGPFLGVWMSLVASDRVPLGIAQTLCSSVPIFILPVSVILYKERVSPRAAIGALIAVAGSALLFIRV